MGLISRVSSRTYRHNMSQIKVLFCFILSIFSTAALSEKVLVLTDGSNIQVTHSVFFSNIKRAGFDLDFKTADDTSLVLVEYVVNGGNVLLGLDSRVTDTVRATASEFGVETDT